MSQTTVSDLSAMLSSNAEAVAKHLLGGQGKREGQELRFGDISGGAGKSLGVHLAGSKAGARDKELHFNARPGAPDWGILQNPYLLERAEIRDFRSSFRFNGDGSFSYTSDLLLKLAATGEEMHHTDENTLRKVD